MKGGKMITGHIVSGMMQNVSSILQNYFGAAWPNNGQLIGPIVGAMIAFVVILIIGLWIYTSFAYMEIAKKLKYKYPGLAWVPFARGAMILQLGGFNWALIFLLLVPVLGWIAVAILYYISKWRIFEKRKYSGWLALIPLAGMIPFLSIFAEVAFLIALGFVAWQDKKGKR
jgi:hypothetical protein